MSKRDLWIAGNSKDENIPHRIAVCSGNEKNPVVLIAAFASWLREGNVRLHEMPVDISMRALGDEIIDDDAIRVQEALRTAQMLGAYSLPNALQGNSDNDSLALLMMFMGLYCGRVLFKSIQEVSDLSEADSVIFIAEPNDENSKKKALEYLRLTSKRIPITFAVVSDKVYGDNTGCEQYLIDKIPDLTELLKGRTYNSYWYNPYGFNRDNKMRSADDPSPIGVEDVFWDSVQKAAKYRYDVNSEIMKESQQIIAARRSVYQQRSVRRQLELNKARFDYAHSAVKLYSSENLISLCSGTLQSNANSNSKNQ